MWNVASVYGVITESVTLDNQKYIVSLQLLEEGLRFTTGWGLIDLMMHFTAQKSNCMRRSSCFKRMEKKSRDEVTHRKEIESIHHHRRHRHWKPNLHKQTSAENQE